MCRTLTVKDLHYSSHQKKGIWSRRVGYLKESNTIALLECSVSEDIISGSSSQGKVSWKQRCGLDMKQKGIPRGLSPWRDGDEVLGVFQGQ